MCACGSHIYSVKSKYQFMGDRHGDCRVRSYKDLGAIESGAYYKILFQSTISMLRIHSFFSGEPLPPWFYFKVRDFL